MITNTGRYIITKYLLGQIPAYASYMAVGCGSQPKKDMTFSVTKKAATGGLATITFSNAQLHTFKSGDAIYVADVDPRLDGTRVITLATTTTVQFLIESLDTISLTTLSGYSGNASYSYIFKETLDFEMLRIPITSRGYVRENGVSKIVLTAELPTPDKYEITEVGIYPAIRNPSANGLDSQQLFLFSESEEWVAHKNGSAVSIPEITEKLTNQDETIDPGTAADSTDGKIFMVNADNEAFNQPIRENRQEKTRFLNDTIVLRGDSSSLVKDLTYGPQGLEVEDIDAMHIHKGGINIDLSRQSPVDQIKLAFSVLSKDIDDENGISGGTAIDEVRLMVRFSSSDHLAGEHSAEFAQMNVNIGSMVFEDNRYFVATSELQDLYQTPQFTWSLADYAIIYASVYSKYAVTTATTAAGVVTITTANPHGYAVGHTVSLNSTTDPDSSPYQYEITEVSTDTIKYVGTIPAGGITSVSSKSANYYVALDAMRFENIANISSVYGLVGYSEVSANYEGYPRAIPKKQNTSNFIEFRYALDVE